jgi:hypothetical protein
VAIDLFFVISGYLITTILLKEHMQTRRVSLTSFYRRQALRLLPTLAILCLAFLLYAAGRSFYRSLLLRQLDARIRFRVAAIPRQNMVAGQRGAILYALAGAFAGYHILQPPRDCGATLRGSHRHRCRLWRVVLALHVATANRLYNGTDTRADALLIGAALSIALATRGFVGSQLTPTDACR